MVSRGNKDVRDLLEQSPKSVSMILGPDGQPVSEVIREGEGIAYAELDLAKCIVPKQFQDVVGYYNRFDVFEFKVNRRAHRPAHFHGEVADAETEVATTSARPAQLDPLDTPAVTLAS